MGRFSLGTTAHDFTESTKSQLKEQIQYAIAPQENISNLKLTTSLKRSQFNLTNKKDSDKVIEKTNYPHFVDVDNR